MNYKGINTIVFVFFITGCFASRGVIKKRYKKNDFYLYKRDFLDSSHKIKYNGIYKIYTSSAIGFIRFFPDGRVCNGSCYDYNRNEPNNCYDNDAKIDLYGYYGNRNDTVLLEFDDNEPLSKGLRVDVMKLKEDTLVALYSFTRDVLKDKTLKKIPKPGDKGVLVGTGNAYFTPVDLTSKINLNW